MCKRFFSVVMAVVMLVFCIPMSVSAGEKKIFDRVRKTYNTSVRKEEVVTSTEIEGITISCKYVKNTREYFLYLDAQEYKLDVSFDGNDIFFDIINETEINTNAIYGQSPALLGLGLLAPEVITAIEGCLVGVASAIGVTGVAYVSVELLDEIGSSGVYVKINTEVADAAVSVATSGVTTRTEHDDSYFEAVLQKDGTIFIGKLLTYKDALYRLKKGYDIFAIDQFKAAMLATIASPVNKFDGPEYHNGKGDRYYHYHPVGISWYKNEKHRPHVWYS